MISNNILLEIIHKDKFSRGRYKEPKISFMETIKENNKNASLAKRNSIYSNSPVKAHFDESDKQSTSEFGCSREIKGISLHPKKKFFPLPKLFQSKKENLGKRTSSNFQSNFLSKENNLDKNKNNNKNYTEFNMNSQLNSDRKNSNVRLFYESVTSCFSLNRSLKSQGESLFSNEYYNTDKFFTKLKSISKELPKQKNYAFYSKEPASFKNLKHLNKTKRSTLDFKKLEGQLSPRASEEYFNCNSQNSNFMKNQSSKRFFSNEKYFNYLENSKEKDINFVKDHFGITQKSSKIKNLGFVQKKEKIESIKLRNNIGEKFIEFFEKKKMQNKIDLENDSELSNEQDNLSYSFKFDTKTSEEKNYFAVEKQNGFSGLLKKLKSEESTRNLIKSDRNAENTLHGGVYNDNNENMYFYSSSNVSNNLKNPEANFLLNKKNQKHFIQRVKERIERINRL